MIFYVHVSIVIIRVICPFYRMILMDVPVIEGVTTIHFPDIEAVYFRSLLDFLYSGETYVPATDVEHLHDLLDLLQIKPGVWRTGDKNGKEPVEVLSRTFTEKNQKLDDHHLHHPHHQTHTDINSNEGSDTTAQLRRSKSRESSSSHMSVKRERMNENSCDDDEQNELDDDEFDRSSLRISRKFSTDDIDEKLDEDDDEERMHRSETISLQKPRDVGERRRSSSDPVNLSLGFRDRDEESNDGHIDVETIGTAPSKVSVIGHLEGKIVAKYIFTQVLEIAF